MLVWATYRMWVVQLRYNIRDIENSSAHSWLNILPIFSKLHKFYICYHKHEWNTKSNLIVAVFDLEKILNKDKMLLYKLFESGKSVLYFHYYITSFKLYILCAKIHPYIILYEELLFATCKDSYSLYSTKSSSSVGWHLNTALL